MFTVEQSNNGNWLVLDSLLPKNIAWAEFDTEAEAQQEADEMNGDGEL